MEEDAREAGREFLRHIIDDQGLQESLDRIDAHLKESLSNVVGGVDADFKQKLIELDRQWEATYGAPPPKTEEELERWAARIGFRPGEFDGTTAGRLFRYIEGRLLDIKDRQADGDNVTIAPEHQTRPMSKREAAKYLGRPNPSSGVKWLNACIEDGTIRYKRLSRQSSIYDCTQFPAKVQSSIRPK